MFFFNTTEIQREINILKNRGADINIRGFKEYKSLHYRAEHRHLKLIKFLLERGPDVN